MKFDLHAFISYAHLDNEPLTPDQKGWVTQFHATLQTMLAQRIGGPARIWRDDKLTGNDVFSDEILDRFARTALLVFILTPRYLKSEWCTREIRAFCEAALRSGGLLVRNKSRVFKVVKTPVASTDGLPDVAEQVIGYDFYDESGAHELDPVFGEHARQEFLRKISKLAWDLAQLVDALGADETGNNDPAAAPKATVYLAEVGRDQRAAREIIEADLVAHGYEVLPSRRLPVVEEDLLVELNGLLGRCQFSIHLVGNSYGLVPDGPSQRSIVMLQNDVAAGISRSGSLRRIIWLPEGTVGEHPEQQQFVRELHGDARLQRGADLLTGDLESLKGAIHAALRRLEQIRQWKSALPDRPGGLRTVHVLMDREDRRAVLPLLKFLKSRGFAVSVPVFTGEAGALREANRQLLERCDALILFYGTGDEAWKFHQQNEIRKQMGLRADRAPLFEYVCLAPPRTPDKELLLSLEEPRLIDGLDGFSEAAMAAFLNALEAQPSDA